MGLFAGSRTTKSSDARSFLSSCNEMSLCVREHLRLTDAGGDRGTALLVAFGTAVAGDTSDAILAGALARGLVACLAGSTHRVAVTGWGGGRGGRC